MSAMIALRFSPLFFLANLICGGACRILPETPHGDTDTYTDADSTENSDGDGDGDTIPEDCDAHFSGIEPKFLEAPAAEDFVFDNIGNLLSIESGDLFRTRYGSPPELWVPAVGGGSNGFTRGTRILVGGDLVVADPSSNSIFRINKDDGSKTVVIGNLSDPNGIAVDLAGFIYLTLGTGEVRRIDPNSGANELLFEDAASLDGITFSHDYRKLYFNTEEGQIYRANIESGGTLSDAESWVTVPTELLLDGMTTDICGNIYVVEMSGSIVRVESATGEQTTVTKIVTTGGSDPAFIPAVNFGSGRGGWKSTALYVQELFKQGVYEIDIGIRGKKEPHLQ